MTYRIAPSILAADFSRLGNEIETVIACGADWIHFDVMDNHYVPNLSIGPGVAQAIRPNCQSEDGAPILLDVHLMVDPVDDLANRFATAGANLISFHPDATRHVDRTIELIRDAGCQVGLAFNPASTLDVLDWTIDKIDLILIMSVNPGFGGQRFINYTLHKVAQARKRIDASGRDISLQVDGGIDVSNIRAIAQAGADTFVAGSAIFRQADYARVIREMRAQLPGATTLDLSS